MLHLPLAARLRRALSLALALGVCAAAVACGDAAPASETAAPPRAGQEVLRSLDEILAGPVTIADLTPDSASVRVQTAKPVMCSVVYGVDERYGSQSTDPDMGGQPHADHHAPLRALPPTP